MVGGGSIISEEFSKSIETEALFTMTDLVWFYAISIIVGHLMLNPFHTCISNI